MPKEKFKIAEGKGRTSEDRIQVDNIICIIKEYMAASKITIIKDLLLAWQRISCRISIIIVFQTIVIALISISARKWRRMKSIIRRDLELIRINKHWLGRMLDTNPTHHHQAQVPMRAAWWIRMRGKMLKRTTTRMYHSKSTRRAHNCSQIGQIPARNSKWAKQEAISKIVLEHTWQEPKKRAMKDKYLWYQAIQLEASINHIGRGSYSAITIT